ncbi:hypothetical protein BGZ89_011087 [Linnemannia elongata]|nr:hypothetical protein BGZ89_011087 [Linnemannia elongata]
MFASQHILPVLLHSILEYIIVRTLRQTRRYFLRDPDCQLLVQCQFNDALFIENPETNSHSYPEVLSTDPVEQTPYPIWDTELAWDLDAEVLDILRIERASLKLNCFAVNQKTNEEESLGHIILDLSSAFEPDSTEERWKPLTGSNTAGFRGLQPELKIAFSIDDGISEITPTIDTLLTSIESSSGSEDLDHAEQHTARYSKSNLHPLQGLEEEDEEQYEDEDQDRQVPSAGDKSFYDTRDDEEDGELDAQVPEFDVDEAMQMDIPVDIGEAMIPTEVNDKGFLQLGLGRDFFIFTITIQTTRNIDRLVERYASTQGKSTASVHQGLYLYYSFLGNDVATQFLSSTAESGAPIEEIALRLKSSMESMYQHFRDGEQLVLHLCHDQNLIGIATIPLAVILLHGTANLFHASPQFYPFQPAIASDESGSKQSPSDVAFVQVAMHVTRDLNTLSVPSTPAIRRSSQGAASRRATRPAAIEVDTSRKVNSSHSSRSPRRHDYKFAIELRSFKSLSRHLNNVSLRYNYRPFGPKSTQPPVNVSRLVPTVLPDARRTFQLCQTPEALRNQLKTPLVVEVWCQHPETHQNVLHASGQIHLIDILDETSAPTSEGRVQQIESSFVVVLEDSNSPVGEIQFSCSLEDLGEYFDSQQSEILSTTPVHSMELHNRHSRGFSDDMASSGPEPQYGFQPRGSNYEVVSSEQDDERAQRAQRQQQEVPSTISRFAEGYSESDRMETPTATGRTSQRPTSVRLSQVRHLSQAHQNSHPHHHHPYGKPASPSGKTEPPMDFQTILKQQLAKQAELNRQVEYDLLRRSPISSLPHSLQQTLQAEKSNGRPNTTLDSIDRSMIDGLSEDMSAQQAKQKMKDLKALDYQVQKQLIALEFRERKLLRAEEALQRQQTNFQKVLDRHGYTQGAFQHPDQPFVLQAPSNGGPNSSFNNGSRAPMAGSTPSAQDFFLLQDRFRALQRQNQLMEAEFNQYRQEHPAHINMTSVNALHQSIAELESNNSKLMNDITFANNYKEHYKALWTHSLQEIASMRQDLQMGMEIKMMQQFNEVDQLKLMGMTRAEADHGQDRIILRGIKTELEMLQHQMQPSFPDDDMSWEQPLQEVPGVGFGRHQPGDREDDEEDADDQSQRQYGRRGPSQYSAGQQQQQQQQPQHQHQSRQQPSQQNYRSAATAGSSYETFPTSTQIFRGSSGDGAVVASATSKFQMNNSRSAANLSFPTDDDEEQETTLVDTNMLKSMSGGHLHHQQQQLQQFGLHQQLHQKHNQQQPQQQLHQHQSTIRS